MTDGPTFTVSEIAERVGGAVEGDAAAVVRRVASLEQATPDSLSWVGTPEFTPRALKSNAGVLLIPHECSIPPDRTVIRVADPDLALCEVLELMAPIREQVAPGVHATATVASSATVESAAIGANVVIGSHVVVGAGTQLHPGVCVGSDSTIGRDCVLWPHVVVREHVTIGDRVVIHPNATIGADGFGYLQREGRHRKIPQIGTVVIEDDVEVGANCTIDRARSGVTRVGRGTKIDNLVQIGHNVDIGEHCIIVAQTAMGGSSSIGNHVMLSGQVAVGDHVHIADGVQVAAKSSVMSSVTRRQVLRGIPAVEHSRFLREQAGVRKLPKWLARLKELGERVDRLESRDDETA